MAGNLNEADRNFLETIVGSENICADVYTRIKKSYGAGMIDALRLSFWGDWENCDRKGNLIANDHLDLLDYVVAEGSKRGIYFLLSPIVTYNSMWPEMQDDPMAAGFSRYLDKGGVFDRFKDIIFFKNFKINQEPKKSLFNPWKI